MIAINNEKDVYGNNDSLLEARDRELQARAGQFNEEAIRQALRDDESLDIAKDVNGILDRLNAKIVNFDKDRKLGAVIADSLAVIAKER